MYHSQHLKNRLIDTALLEVNSGGIDDFSDNVRVYGSNLCVRHDCVWLLSKGFVMINSRQQLCTFDLVRGRAHWIYSSTARCRDMY